MRCRRTWPRALAATIVAAAAGPIEAVPSLETALSDAHRTIPAAAPMRPARARQRGAARPAAGLALATVVAGSALGVGISAWLHRPAPTLTASRHVAAATPPRPRPTRVPTAAPTTAPTAAPTTSAGATSGLQGPWRVSEANRYVGPMIWTGGGTVTGGTLVLDLHKDRIDGSPATRCERATTLHMAIDLGTPEQPVPFHETNCTGTVTTGELRVSSFSPASAGIHGSFWEGGVKLGDFTASRL